MTTTMISRFAILSVLATIGLAATPAPSTTEALQTFLSVSNLDASQAAQIHSAFVADHNSYQAALTTDPSYASAFSVANTALPNTAKAAAAADPALYLASLAKDDSDDLPAWFASMPTPVQEFWRSVGSQEIEMYTSEVNEARPLPSSVSASLSSKAGSATSSLGSATASAVAKGAAPASPATSGHMMVVAVGVAIAAGLVGMAML
ncbi:MAG: hypothetical protein LQ338_002435 [Usnochroma carphineum]|nr:MAG: hypothetical protein LQ338_002435 [Usnochroma carphineum]